MHDFKGTNNPRYKTGLRMAGKTSGLYRSWGAMKQRCLNPKNPKYARYGGRGIKVCDEWLDIFGFAKWAKENGWAEGLTIDRIDNNKDYCPENCRWVSVSENSKKKSTTKLTDEDANNIRKRINEDWYKIAEEYGCTHGNIWFIMHNRTHITKDF